MRKSQHSHHSSSKPVSQIPSLYTSSTSSTSSSPFLEQPSLHSSYHGGERLCLLRKAHPQQDKMRQTYRSLSSIYIHTETPTVKSTTFATSQRKKKKDKKEKKIHGKLAKLHTAYQEAYRSKSPRAQSSGTATDITASVSLYYGMAKMEGMNE